MTVYYVRVALNRERVVKVEAPSAELAVIGAEECFADDVAAWPAGQGEYVSEFVDESAFDDDDSIYTVQRPSGVFWYYEFAEDDPGGRGATE